MSLKLQEFQVIGRKQPTAANLAPKLYRMTLFARDSVVAKSRFWYFLQKVAKVKKASGEIVSVTPIHEKSTSRVKNFGVWLRYNSRSGTHNMYKEYRELSRNKAVAACYMDMASRHRARFGSIHIIKVSEVEAKDVKRPYMRQFINPTISFPLPHRVMKVDRAHKTVFSGVRPNTYS